MVATVRVENVKVVEPWRRCSAAWSLHGRLASAQPSGLYTKEW